MAILVSITECYGDRKTTHLRAKTDDLEVAIDRAIKKAYGAGRSFHRDNGISVGRDALQGTQYGQIGKPVKRNPCASSMQTGRVSIKAEIE